MAKTKGTVQAGVNHEEEDLYLVHMRDEKGRPVAVIPRAMCIDHALAAARDIAGLRLLNGSHTTISALDQQSVQCDFDV